MAAGQPPLSRRGFLRILLGAAAAPGWSAAGARIPGEGTDPLECPGMARPSRPPDPAAAVTLFLAGDVMTGRGIDQVLPHPGDPVLYESYVKDARRYVELAEAASGPVPHPVDFPYIWGDALGELERVGPQARIVNLETAVTASGEPWPGKEVCYRMHPANAPCLTAAGLDACGLANNHVLDWGRPGLLETLETLRQAGIRTAGAGRDLVAAAAPAAVELPGEGRVLLFALGSTTSGTPPAWAAAEGRAGVHLLPAPMTEAVAGLGEGIRAARRPGDLVVASLHWGGNWGYEIPPLQRELARGLVEEAGVDVVHGHSSHHVKGIEVHRGRLILYGCGDLLTDYEGIGGFESFRGDLGLMYFPRLDRRSGALLSLEMTPIRMRRLRLTRASIEEARWLRDTLEREGRELGTAAELGADGRLALRWEGEGGEG